MVHRFTRICVFLAIVCVGVADLYGCASPSAGDPQMERIKEKAGRAQTGVKNRVRSGGDPAPILKLMKQVRPNLEDGDLDQAESLLDQALKMLEEQSGVPQRTVRAGESVTDLFHNPRRVAIEGYKGDAMEPFISRDGKYLFFNNLNDPRVNTNLFYAERIDDQTYRYAGEVKGVNTRALEGVPSMDRNNRFFFSSPRKGRPKNSAIFSGQFERGGVKQVDAVQGELSRTGARWYALGAEASPDGETIYYVQAQKAESRGPPKSMNLKVAHLRNGRFEVDPNSDEIFKHINTKELEYAPAISSDELELYFTRAASLIVGNQSRGRDLRIYMATRKSKTEAFGAPSQITAIEGFIEGPTITDDGKILYYHKKDGKKFAIYMVERRR